MKKRRVWKTFYIQSGDAFNSLDSVWRSTSEKRKNGKPYVMHFEGGIGLIETDLPIRTLRSLFRIADVKWQEYVSDTKPTNEH